ncbi:MAG: T9SS type A sorting domain-containing protein [Bacteroidota bacterium]
MKPYLKTTYVLLIALLPHLTFSQALGYNNNRIAVSADGNNQPDNHPEANFPRADPDDWGGTPAALAMIAKLGLQGKLVHYSYNNFMEAPKHTNETNYMADAANGAIARWNFNGKNFFDVSNDKQTANAISHLANQMRKSTASDPLYYIHMGPAEFFYRAVQVVVDGGNLAPLSHVQVVSHSGYNDTHLRRLTHHTMQEAISLSGNRIKYQKIRDQNSCSNPNVLWCSGTDFTPFQWMENHPDQSMNWLYSRLQFHPSGKGADVSDAGMVYYLLTGDESGNLSKLQNFIGNRVVPEDNYDGCIVEEQNGLLVFEAERFSLQGSWKIGTDTDKASGGQFIYYDGANSFGKVDASQYCFYTFRINNPGNYTLKWTMRQPEGEQGSDLGNDAWFYFVEDRARAFGGTEILTAYHKFVGRSDDDFTFNGSVDMDHSQSWVSVSFPSAGEYTLKLGGRSKGFEVDRFVLYNGRTLGQTEAEIATLAETSDCSVTPDEETISLVNPLTTFDDGLLQIPVTVNYTASESRIINVAITEADGTFIRNQRVTVSEGTGQANLFVNLITPLVDGNEYKMFTSLRNLNGTFQDNVLDPVIHTFTITPDPAVNTIGIVNSPQFITGTVNTLTIGYSATQDRDVIVQLRKGGTIVKAVKETVSGGTSEKTMTITLDDAPTAGNDYAWRAIIRPVGASWERNINFQQVNNVSAGQSQAVSPEAGRFSSHDDFGSGTNSNREDQNVEVLVYPNPFTSDVNLSLPVGHEFNHAVISDLQGKVVYKATLTGQKPLELEAFAQNARTGIYLLKLIGAESPKVLKLIKR